MRWEEEKRGKTTEKEVLGPDVIDEAAETNELRNKLVEENRSEAKVMSFLSGFF